MNLAQPMDISSKRRARTRRVIRAKATGKASSQREAHEGKRMRTQASMFSAYSGKKGQKT